MLLHTQSMIPVPMPTDLQQQRHPCVFHALKIWYSSFSHLTDDSACSFPLLIFLKSCFFFRMAIRFPPWGICRVEHPIMLSLYLYLLLLIYVDCKFETTKKSRQLSLPATRYGYIFSYFRYFRSSGSFSPGFKPPDNFFLKYLLLSHMFSGSYQLYLYSFHINNRHTAVNMPIMFY